MASTPGINSRRFQITMSKDILSEVDDYSKKIGISRSSTISVLCRQALNYEKANDSLSMFLKNDGMKVLHRLQQEQEQEQALNKSNNQ